MALKVCLLVNQGRATSIVADRKQERAEDGHVKGVGARGNTRRQSRERKNQVAGILQVGCGNE